MPLGKSPILQNDLMAEGDNNKHLLVNNGLVAIEDSENRNLNVNMAAGNVVLTASQITRFAIFTCSGHTVGRTLTIPLTVDGGGAVPTNRKFSVRNTGTAAITVTHPGGTVNVVIGAGEAGLLYANGTDVISLGGVAAAGTVGVSDEGTLVLAAPTNINFAGDSVTVTDDLDGTVTVTVTPSVPGATIEATLDAYFTNTVWKTHPTASQIEASLDAYFGSTGWRAVLTAAQVKSLYESNANTNAFTDAEQAKLAGLEASSFKGTFLNATALAAAHPNPVAGSYAYVDAGVGAPTELYIWDDDDNQWRFSGGAGSTETAASIKTKYESNANTNAFTDAEKTKLAGIEAGATADMTGGEIVTAINSQLGGTTWQGGGGGGAVAVEDDGVEVVAAASRINFAGAGVTVTDAGLGEVTVTIPGGGAGGVGSTTFVGARRPIPTLTATTISTWVKAPLGAAAFDTHSFNGPADNFVVPAGVTQIRVRAFVRSNTSTVNNQWAPFINNAQIGAASGGFTGEIDPDGYSNGGVSIVSGVLNVVAGDTVDLRYFVASTAGTTYDGWVEIEAVTHTLGGGGGSTFLALTDTPAAYTGQAGKFLAVNAGATGVEFVDAPAGGGGTAEASLVRAQAWGLSADTGLLAPTSPITVPFNAPDATYDDLGITLSAGVFTIPAALNGAKVRWSANIRTNSDANGFWSISLLKNGTVIQIVEVDGPILTFADGLATFAPVPIATGDTFAIQWRQADTAIQILTGTIAVAEVVQTVSVGGSGGGPLAIDRVAIPVVNGNFETGNLTGWTVSSGSPIIFEWATRPSWATVLTAPRHGTWMYDGGTSASSSIQQDIAITPDDSTLFYEVAADFLKDFADSDNGRLQVDLLNSGGAVLASNVINGQLSAPGWINNAVTVPYHPEGVTLRIIASTIRTTGTNNNCGIDNITAVAVRVTGTSGGGGGAVAVEDEGTEVVAAASRLNFTGAGVTVTDSGAGEIQIDIPGGGGTAAEWSANALTNGGFDTGDLTGWTVGGTGNVASVTSARSAALAPFEGTHIADNSTGALATLTQSVAIPAGTTFVNFMVWAAQPFGGDRARAVYRIRSSGGTVLWTEERLVDTTAAVGVWFPLGASSAVPTGGVTAEVELRFENVGGSNAAISFDSASVRFLTLSAGGGGGGGLADAPSDGGTYGRKDGAWVNLLVPQPDGLSANFDTNTSAATLSTSAFATKGNVLIANVDRFFTGVTFLVSGAAPTQTVSLFVAEVDAGNLVTNILLNTGVVSVVNPANGTIFAPPTPILFEAGKRYAVAFVRTDGSGTAALNISFPGAGLATDANGHFTLVDRGTRLAANPPVVGSDMIDEGLASGGCVEYVIRSEGVVVVSGGGGGGATTFLGLTDTPAAYTGQGGKVLAVNAGATGVEFIDPPAGGGGGAAALNDLTDVIFNTSLVDSSMIGRPLGVIQTTPSVQVGLLSELAALPVRGGFDILASHDFGTTPLSILLIEDTHLYDEIIMIGFGLVGANILNVQVLPDGVSASTEGIIRARWFAPTATTVNTAISTEVGGFISLAPNMAPAGGSLRASFTGLRAGLPLSMERFFGGIVSSAAYVHHEHAVMPVLSDIQALRISSSTNYTAGFLFVIGVRQSAQPMVAPFDYTGSPTGAGTLSRFVLPMGARLRNGPQGSFRVTANPTTETVIEVRKNGTSVGTITIPATTGAPVVSITTTTDFVAGDVITLASTASGDFTDLFGSLLLEGRA